MRKQTRPELKGILSPKCMLYNHMLTLCPYNMKSGLGASPLVPVMGYTINTAVLSPGA